MDLSEYVLEPVHTDASLALYRGKLRHPTASREPSILLIRPVSEHPAPATLERLGHEYALADELPSAGTARPLALTEHEGRPALILEDGGGAPLDTLVGKPMPLGLFLRVAAGLASAVRELHAHGIIHKDVKPAHTLVDAATGRVWLTGFGIASRLRRERQALQPPEFIAGTLAYMAPEQTGRMNRSIDSRSDLYALGVTFYQMLTGVLPFPATEPMEWVHSHIARKPIPPNLRLPEIPARVSAIVMKLLAKTAEDRYQTAAGLEADLESCRADWAAHHRIEDVPVGQHDTPDQLVLPEKLYGREREVETLLAAFDRVVKGGVPELVLVSGYSGIGKSSVVNELQPVLVPPRGLFASGKFDQYQRDTPYSTLAQAFESLVRQLLTKSELELGRWRRELRDALEPNGQLIVDLVPELKLVIGEQPPVPALPGQDAQRRFHLAFRQFIGVFARQDHPLALFFDDLQWLDAATLDVLEDLLTKSELKHLLLIGAYRDNEVDAAHPLVRKLAAIESAGGAVRRIALGPLTDVHLAQLLGDALRCAPERSAPLARLVQEKTGGNPFFAIQFIASLAEAALLAFDHDRARWSWDLDRIHAKEFTDNVVDLLVMKLARLPAPTQTALQKLACLGNISDIATVAIALEASAEEVHAALWEGVRQGLVERLDGSYKFIHDRVHEAAHSSIPVAARPEAHLRIGRLLQAHTPAEKRDEKIFDIVNHLNLGAPLIGKVEEREHLAELNLIAGRRAKAAIAYASALRYFCAGAPLLGDEGWERRRELRFALELERGECEFLTGEVAAADERLTALSKRTASALERAAVASLQMDACTERGQFDRAVAVALDYLRHVGIEFSPHPTDDEVQREYEQIWSELGDRSVEQVLDLPLMSEAEALATVGVLIKGLVPALVTDRKLESLTVCRAVNLSLRHGNCDASCLAYVAFGKIAATRFGNYPMGARFGQVGFELVESRGLKRLQAGTYLAFALWIVPWSMHVRTASDLLRRAFDAAIKVGDLSYAANTTNSRNTALLAAGVALGEVQREAELGLAFARKGQLSGGHSYIILPQLALARTLRGSTPTFGCLDCELLEEQAFESELAANPFLRLHEFWYWLRKLQARYHAGDYAAALEISSKAQELVWTSSAYIEEAEYRFYGALCRASSYDAATSSERQEHVRALAEHQRLLDVWAENCPANFENRAALVGAELARIEGRELDAERLYEKAIVSARRHGFLQNEALANELAARFYSARGFETIGRAYLRNARYAYLRWGADGKVRQLDEAYPDLASSESAAASAGMIGAPVEQLDLATVVKVSEAVSGEIVLERLIEALLRTAIEHAGAERGLLISARGDALTIDAEANTDGNQVSVRLRERPISASEVAESLVRYAARSRESVVLGDASTRGAFAADEYIRRRQVRSALCLPLVKQGRLVALLYLENSLARDVFTPARTAVLRVLASQAAMGLENGRLYRELQEREAKIRRLVEANIVGVLITSLDGQVIEANDAFLGMLGLTRDDLAASRIKWTELTPPEWREVTDAAVARLRDTGTAELYEKEYFRKDGSRVPVLVAAAALEGTPLQVVAFVVDLSERKQAEADRRAKDVAEMANRAKDLFMANVSHEIRTPMNAILGMAELVLDGTLEAEQRMSVSTIKSAAENLLIILDDLLDFAKIEAGKVELAHEPFVLRAVVRDCLRMLAVRAHRKGLDLLCDVAAAVPDEVEGDAVRLRQVLVNLVGNAIKFTEHGEIAVTIEVAGDELRFSVRDTGIGIADGKRAAIFEAFEQADSATARRYGGTGLGLSIASRLVQLMGGDIAVESAPGHGSTFTFTAKLAAHRPRAASPPPAVLKGARALIADDNRSTREVLERWMTSWGMETELVTDAHRALAALRDGRFDVAVIDAGMDDLRPLNATRVVYLGAMELPETLARLRRLGGGPHVAKPVMAEELQAAIVVVLEGREHVDVEPPRRLPARRVLRVLVAEDNDFNQQLMRQLLTKRGDDVAIAADGRRALELIASSLFDVLLLDIHLPVLDGFAVVAALRERERQTGRHLYVVATTARAGAADREACLAAGMDDFLPKPLSATALWRVLDRVANGSPTG